MARRRAELDFPSISIEGALFPGDFLARIAHLAAPEQQESDYRIPKKLHLRDELGRYFRIAEGLWQDFQARKGTGGSDARRVTVEALLLPFLKQVLGFDDVTVVGAVEQGGRRFPIGHAALSGRVPLVMASHDDELDEPTERYGDEHRRRSPFLLAQEYLNAGSGAVWALVSNGRTLRLLRDNPSLTRPAYVEFNLQRLFEERLYPDFAVLWLTCHASRFGAPGVPLSDCALERWRNVAQQEGTRARERLRFGVADALRELGTGFLAAPGNTALREQITKGELTSEGFYQQLLRLIYRLLFLFTIEERSLIHGSGASQEAMTLYAGGYSLSHLRGLAAKRRRFDRHHDLWQALLVTFGGLAKGELALALPGLGGLFRSGECPDLDTADVSNRALLEAIYKLAFFVEDGSLVRVNYRDMGPEELGSIYEALLELVPEIDTASHPWRFRFVGDDAPPGEGSVAGNARKLTGSYYTPDSLVQELIKSALIPVVEDRLRGAEDPEKALLSIKVLDPACGSGHFLLAAARKLAENLAKVRATGRDPRPEDYRRSLRDVVSHCIFGVDRNRLALELARTALWLETFSPDRPLGFLDHHLRCGDALIGILDPEILAEGIPDAAFEMLTGDDKVVARDLGKKNAAARKNLAKERERLAVMQELAIYEAEGGLLDAMPEESIEQVEAKRHAFAQSHRSAEQGKSHLLADSFVAAFFACKDSNVKDAVPTTEDFHRILRSVSPRPGVAEMTHTTALDVRAFHWHLEFPEVLKAGGFDVLLANPPWEVSQLSEEEYFASRLPNIAGLRGEGRKQAIAALQISNPLLWQHYLRDKRRFEAANNFFRRSARYPLTGAGKINLYSLFAETIDQLRKVSGRAGFIVPSGIATDHANQTFFGSLMSGGTLVSLFGFDNAERLFPAVHPDTPFALITLGQTAGETAFVHYALNVSDLTDQRRCFRLTGDTLRNVNPNTGTCPIYRSKADAALNEKIYARVPVLVNEAQKINSWGVDLIQNFFSSSNRVDRKLFVSAANALGDTSLVPVMRGTMIDQFDHCSATYSMEGNKFVAPVRGNSFEAVADKYVPRAEVVDRLRDRAWDRGWLMGWRDITNATNWRTVIASVLPIQGADDTLSLILPHCGVVKLAGCLLANLNALVLDYIAQNKVGGTHVRKYVMTQLPVLPPSAYSEVDVAYIVPRVLELTYTTSSLSSWASDLGYLQEPFQFDSGRRTRIRAELDAYYARMYGLTRDELRYVLDPADVMGNDYPSQTFKVLKNSEEREFGEYLTRRLVLEAWDRQAGDGMLAARRPSTVVVPMPVPVTVVAGAWARPMTDQRAEVGALLSAILKTMTTATPPRQVRLAATLALQPSLLKPYLSASEASEWGRIVGTEADPLPQGAVAFSPAADRAWGDAVRTLRANGYLVEDARSGTWSPGANVGALQTDGWPEGRAKFVLTVLERHNADAIVRALPAQDRAWIDAAQAA